MKLELTIEEASALANLLDLAVKAGGIRVAGVAAEFMNRLEAAAAAEKASEGHQNEES